MSNVVVLAPVPANLLTGLVDYHTDLICQPAAEALSATRLGQVKVIVGRHVAAGNLNKARELVAAEIEVSSVSAEATRHMHQSDCRYCPDFWKLCPNLDRLERRENDLHYQIARLGGV
jgi:hypothetical protein